MNVKQSLETWRKWGIGVNEQQLEWIIIQLGIASQKGRSWQWRWSLGKRVTGRQDRVADK